MMGRYLSYPFLLVIAPIAYIKISYVPSHLVLRNLVLREVNLKWIVPFIGYLFLSKRDSH
jgi:hypothetical protein